MPCARRRLRGWPGEDILEHHVVRQQDVGTPIQDPLPGLGQVLPGVPVEGDRPAIHGYSPFEILLQLVELAVRQRVHGVDHDRRDAVRAGVTEDGIHDRHDVGKAFTGSRAGGEHIAAAVPGRLDGFPLVPIQRQRPPAGIAGIPLDPEESAAVGVQQTCADQFVDRAAGGERRVERDPRVRPADLRRPLPLEIIFDLLVANLDEGVGEGRIVLDQAPMSLEDLHVLPALLPTRSEQCPASTSRSGAAGRVRLSSYPTVIGARRPA